MLLAIAPFLHCPAQSRHGNDDSTRLEINGDVYELYTSGDLLPLLRVNGLVIGRKEHQDFEDIISLLERKLAMKQIRLQEQSGAHFQRKMDLIFADLIKDRLISSQADLYSLELHDRAFKINGKPQSYQNFKKYHEKYMMDSQAINYNAR
jgi:hypothetical protein